VKSWVLGSGSRGNAVLLEVDGARVLIDAGFPIRELARRLKSIDAPPTSIEAVIVTHEHTDHARGAAAGARAFGWQIYTSPRTLDADPDLRAAGAIAIGAGETVALSTMDLATVPVPHDAAQPVAVVATARRSGVRTGVAYDLGHVTDATCAGLAELDLLILEANYDLNMLRAGPYPVSVADRIAGPRGHLSNAAAADLARAVVHRGLSRVVLAHLSENCNAPRLAIHAVVTALARTRRGGVPVCAASQHAVTGPFLPGVVVGAVPDPRQLSLEF
jgi:phosphoribosyl 1,2-cyclic phosphodiesterase